MLNVLLHNGNTHIHVLLFLSIMLLTAHCGSASAMYSPSLFNTNWKCQTSLNVTFIHCQIQVEFSLNVSG